MRTDIKKISIFSVATIACAVFAAQMPATPVLVSKVFPVRQNMLKRYVGDLSAVDDVALVPRVSGVIMKQSFVNGDIVKKGQTLFLIENTTYLAQANAAKAKLAQCRAEYEFAKSNLKRLTTLRQQKATSESSFEEAVRLEAATKAAVAAAEAALLDAENNLSYTEIKSPISGKAGKAAVSEFNYVTPNFGNLVTVVSLDPLYVNFSISSRDFLTMFGSFEKFKELAAASIVLADGSVYSEPVEMVFMDNRVDKDTDTIRMRGKIRNKDGKLLPDSLITVKLGRKENREMAGVPVYAVMNNGKMDYVYVLGEKNIPQLRQVVLGEVQGGTQTVKSGLTVGETVVVDGTHKVRPGVPVSPVYVDLEKK